MPEEINEPSKEESERITQDAESKYGNRARDEEEKQETDEQQTQKETHPEEPEQQTAEQTKRKVNSLDPDFIIFFFLACAFDFSDVFTDLITTIVQVPLPKGFGIMIDVMALIIIGGWIYYRSGQIKIAGKAGAVILAVVVEIGSGLGLGITSWIGLFPSWAVVVLSMLL